MHWHPGQRVQGFVADPAFSVRPVVRTAGNEGGGVQGGGNRASVIWAGRVGIGVFHGVSLEEESG